MRLLITALIGMGLLSLVSCIANAQQSTTEKPLSLDYSKDPCGNPLMESQGWSVLRGRVTKVLDGRTLVFSTDGERRNVRIQLAGISVDRTASAKASQALKQMVLNKTVEVSAPADYNERKSKTITGVAHLADNATDVGLSLIKSGLARWQRPKPYTMSSYDACYYRKAETEAREAKVGVWQ